MTIVLTTNYGFKKNDLGHPERDTFTGANLDLIDAAILAGVSPVLSARIIVGNGSNVGVAVAMSGDIGIDNAGVTAIGADKVLNTMLANIARGSVKVGGASNAPTDLDAKTDAQILIGDGADVNSVEVTGDVTIDNAGITAIGAGKVGIAEMAAALLKGIVTLEMSFETDRETATKVYFPFAVEITKIRSIVMKALAATSAGTITCANSVGNSTNGVVTVAAESPLNTEDNASPTTNVAVAADSYYKLTSAKANKGGIVLVTLEYKRVV